MLKIAAPFQNELLCFLDRFEIRKKVMRQVVESNVFIARHSGMN